MLSFQTRNLLHSGQALRLQRPLNDRVVDLGTIGENIKKSGDRKLYGKALELTIDVAATAG